MRPRTVCLLLALAALMGCSAASTQPPAVILGDWGGDHAGLIATADSGTLEYDCAVGRITETLRPDAAGHFAATGTHTPGHGGPSRIDEVPPLRPARYSGRVDGDLMSLTVVMTDSNATVGTFQLTRGRSPNVFKCL